ncbi:MAG: dihydroorotate dehydrogenase [Thermoplasmata archaeon]
MENLQTNILGMELETPLLLASGILDQTSKSMETLLDLGMGGVVTKSIGSTPRKGHPNPTMVELETGLLNAMGLPNPGIDTYLEELEDLKSNICDKPIIGSVYASTTEEFGGLSHKMEKGGVDAVELNLSCPHAEEYGASIASDLELVGEVIITAKEKVDIPVLAKLPPSSEIAEVASVSESAGADGIVAINTVKSMAINFETRKPILGNKVGGYSGKGIKPIGLCCIYEIYEEVDIPTIGCGGITTGRDALEYILAGASALQIGSSIYYRGIDAARKIAEEMSELMQKEDIEKIKDIIGKAH